MVENKLYYLFVLSGSLIFLICLVVFNKPAFFKLIQLTVRQLDVILNKNISEKTKNRSLLKNSGQLLAWLFINTLYFAIALLAGSLPVLLYMQLFRGAETDFSSPLFFVSMLMPVLLFLIPRRKRSDYSYWSKLLHHIVLDNPATGRYLLRQELKRRTKATNQNFIIVSGLARAGTTAMLNLLFASGAFKSIRYSNMPFLLAPVLWRRLYRPKSLKKKERAHKDSLSVDKDSPEAFEEYYFKASLQDAYIDQNHLKKHQLSPEMHKEYLQYQSLFGEENKVYLAKNNNFILRYESLRQQNKDFKLIIMFREPLQHAHSLLRQHRHFTNLQKKDPFVLTYMNWLGHHEFGLNHKTFSLEGMENPYPTDSLNHWLTKWINYYTYILQFSKDPGLYFVSNLSLRKYPEKVLHKLSESIGIDINSSITEHGSGTDNTDISASDPSLQAKAEQIYQTLLKHELLQTQRE